MEIGSSPFRLKATIHGCQPSNVSRLNVRFGREILQVGVRGRRYPEADASGHRVARVQGLQFAAEQMRGEAEAARVLVEHCHQVVGHHVLVGIFGKTHTLGLRIHRGMRKERRHKPRKSDAS